MLMLIFYYLVLPFLAAWLILAFIRKYGKNEIPPDIARLFQDRPIERKWFRVVRRDQKNLKMLGDYEKQAEAVDAAYLGKEEARKEGQAASLLVLNDKGEALEQVDS